MENSIECTCAIIKSDLHVDIKLVIMIYKMTD